MKNTTFMILNLLNSTRYNVRLVRYNPAYYILYSTIKNTKDFKYF